jgi:RNA polymerase sigma factor (sigma-70 family)
MSVVDPVQSAVAAVWRNESARLIAGLAWIVRDVGLAEDLAQDALVLALQQWPDSSIPNNPGAWLMGTAKHRAIDAMRRNTKLQEREAELARAIEADLERHDTIEPDEIADGLLRLMFTACHPVLPIEARVALTLRVLGGLTTEEIAHAFLVPVPTIAKRIVRAKRSLGHAHVGFEVPGPSELGQRLSSVLEVVYLIFNEGYAASTGEDWIRLDLCVEALRLGRLLADLAPREPEAHGLVALMELQASRSGTRMGPAGEAILLPDQDRSGWDQALITRGMTSLLRAQESGGPLGPYTLQAAIAACHAMTPSVEATDWQQIIALYEALGRLMPSPLIELNRAVAVGMAQGPSAGLRVVDTLLDEPALRTYHLLPAVRGDFMYKLGRYQDARAAFVRAAALTQNTQERALLLARATASDALA